MKLFKDILNDAELITDAFHIDSTSSEYFYIITGKNIAISGDIDESMIGGNASEEIADEGTEEVAQIVPNVVISTSLEEVVTFTKPREAKQHVMKYLKDTFAVEADVYNEKKQSGGPFGDKTDYTTERAAIKKSLATPLTKEEFDAENERGNKLKATKGSEIGGKKLDVILWDHFSGKDLFTKIRWYASKDDAFDLEGQVMPLIQEGEEVGDKCTLLVWKHGIYFESC